MVKRQEHDAEWHFDDPRTRKWMVQCVACGVIGYRFDAPEQFFGRFHLVKYFDPISLDDRGLCEECQFALDQLAGS